MVINCDHYCINCHVSDSEVNYRPMQAKYACSDPSTDAGLEECLSVLLAPNGYTTEARRAIRCESTAPPSRSKSDSQFP